ncbi:hypothetical protein M513_04057 [Trichuris suis]|uniref:Uncharacterized protein n=1 Tax=Trichuris suis TaxID=68888 RepID=A0A085MD43_9BILA|nr:hypothetical protein M513_04057 [Trichuris suis]
MSLTVLASSSRDDLLFSNGADLTFNASLKSPSPACFAIVPKQMSALDSEQKLGPEMVKCQQNDSLC